MKKILFSLVLVLSLVFGLSTIKAEEETTNEEETVRNIRENIELQNDGTEIGEFYYDDWENVNFNTLDIYVDNYKIIDDGQPTNENVSYNLQNYDNYRRDIFIILYTTDDYLYYIVANKDGLGNFYKENSDGIEQPMSLNITFTTEFDESGFMPLDGEEIESWLANLLDNYFGWFLVILGVSAATVAGAIVGMVKLVAYFKATQLGLTALNKTNEALSNKVSTLGKKVDNVNKAGALGVYTAEAISEIIDSSTNPRITTRKSELKRKYVKALNAKDLSEEEAEEIKKEFEREFLVKQSTDKEKEKTKQDNINDIVKKIKE